MKTSTALALLTLLFLSPISMGTARAAGMSDAECAKTEQDIDKEIRDPVVCQKASDCVLLRGVYCPFSACGGIMTTPARHKPLETMLDAFNQCKTSSAYKERMSSCKMQQTVADCANFDSVPFVCINHSCQAKTR